MQLFMILNLVGFCEKTYKRVAKGFAWPAVHAHVEDLRKVVRKKVLEENNVGT